MNERSICCSRVHALLSEQKVEEASQAVVQELLKRGLFVG